VRAAERLGGPGGDAGECVEKGREELVVRED
jgi:hypothetical protein